MNVSNMSEEKTIFDTILSVVQSTLVISKSEGLSEIPRDNMSDWQN